MWPSWDFFFNVHSYLSCARNDIGHQKKLPLRLSSLFLQLLLGFRLCLGSKVCNNKTLKFNTSTDSSHSWPSGGHFQHSAENRYDSWGKPTLQKRRRICKFLYLLFFFNKNDCSIAGTFGSKLRIHASRDSPFSSTFSFWKTRGSKAELNVLNFLPVLPQTTMCVAFSLNVFCF